MTARQVCTTREKGRIRRRYGSVRGDYRGREMCRGVEARVGRFLPRREAIRISAPVIVPNSEGPLAPARCQRRVWSLAVGIVTHRIRTDRQVPRLIIDADLNGSAGQVALGSRQALASYQVGIAFNVVLKLHPNCSVGEDNSNFLLLNSQVILVQESYSGNF